MSRSKTTTRHALLIPLPIIIVFFFIDLLLVLHALYFGVYFEAVRFAYGANTILLPAMLLLAGVYCLTSGKRQGRRHAVAIGIATLVVGTSLLALRCHVTHIAPHRLQVRRVTVESRNVSRQIRILHISDVQTVGVGGYETSVFSLIRELEPDVVIDSGDVIQLSGPALSNELTKVAALFASLNPPFGLFAVHGNTDAGVAEEKRATIANVNFLVNSAVAIPELNLDILGLSERASAYPSLASEEITRWLSASTVATFKIVVGHSPDFVFSATNLAVELCLAGHTHGGQIRLPGMDPLFTSTTYIPKSWASGFRKAGRVHLNVSAGVGCEHACGLPDMRLNCPPDITLVTIVPADASPE